jgi:uncharacterized membrane protein
VNSPPAAPRFKERGEEISRLEGCSDCAFGFAITLLVVSLEVPTIHIRPADCSAVSESAPASASR